MLETETEWSAPLKKTWQILLNLAVVKKSRQKNKIAFSPVHGVQGTVVFQLGDGQQVARQIIKGWHVPDSRCLVHHLLSVKVYSSNGRRDENRHYHLLLLDILTAEKLEKTRQIRSSYKFFAK